MLKDLKLPQAIVIGLGIIGLVVLSALGKEYAPFILGVGGFLTLLGFTAKQASDARAETAAQTAKTEQVLVQTNGNNKALVELLAKQHVDHLAAVERMAADHRDDMNTVAAWLAQMMPPPGGLSTPPERPPVNGSSVVGVDAAAAPVGEIQ